jgi:hypothetical protein
MDILILKYGLMTWIQIIQASGITATFAALIDLALKLIFGK